MDNKVLVFGGAGFLGSHISDTLTQKGYQVTVFDIKESKYLKSNQEMIIGDIMDTELINKVIPGNDYVYNFAGIADIDECNKNPLETLKFNILGNSNILLASDKSGVKKFLFASSAYVYSDSGSYYRISKQTSESFIDTFCKNSKMDYVILRYGSLYGERSDRRNSIYKILDDAISKGKIQYFGTGDEVREFINVKDAAELSVNALQDEFDNEILMLTGTKSMKYNELLEMIAEMLKGKVDLEISPKKSNTHYKMTPYSFSPKLAKKLVNNPHIDLGQGILNLIGEIYTAYNPELKEEQAI